MSKIISDEDFISAWKEHNESPQQVAEAVGMDVRNVYKRRNSIEKRLKIKLNSSNNSRDPKPIVPKTRAYIRQLDVDIDTGSIVIFSDAHWWPDQERTPAHAALLKIIKRIKPRMIVANGDVFDGARVSRHAPMGWVEPPTVKQELDTCIDNLAEIAIAAPKGCLLHWTIGNHDQRFDRTLASQIGEYAGTVDRLPDRFPEWEFSWSIAINRQLMIKHRIAGGIHAGYNNTLKSSWSTVTGHTHVLEVKPWADYSGRRWGVQTGSLADLNGDQFEYTENAPSYAGQGFAVITFKDSVMLPPELCEVIDGVAYFRGEEV